MSTIKVNRIENTSTTDGGVSIDTDGHVTIDGQQMPSAGPLSSRNKLINGDMRIDQRNAGAAVTGSTAYPVDRWINFNATDGTYSGQQIADAPSGQGFLNSIKYTVTATDTSIGAAQFASISQRIEGYNVTDLMLGTADAKAFTVSFWVKSSVTGDFGFNAQNDATAGATRGYGTTYNIASANTWEYKTITIPGDTTGAWDTSNSTGLTVVWGLGVGSNFTVSSNNVWETGIKFGAVGVVSLFDTLNATFQITGVQLEVGSKATPFEHESYGQTLAKCQRYFQYFPAGAFGRWNSSTSAELSSSFSVPMRTTPSLSINPNDNVCNIFRVGITTNQCTVSSLNNAYMNPTGGVAALTVSSTASTPNTGDGAAYDPDGDSHVIFCSAEL